ncbi:MAG: T9SS type A sorting domain-containing protein [Ignavibacteria bacterium]|nr:T9SS type A sorting domain-containing protein [Ignavibacteria bacterium]
MRSLFTIISILIGMQAYGQVTITQSNFPRTPNYLDVGAGVGTDGMAVPEHGNGITWNYSGNGLEILTSTTWTSALGDADFPDALNSRAQTLLFNVFQISSRLYESVDAKGWFEPGRIITEVTHSITNFTGGPEDVLTFPSQIQHYLGRVNTLEFPVSYQKSWTQSRDEIIKFELTVMAYGLNKTPGENRTKHSQFREVVGEGKLIIPDINGNPTSPMDALVIRLKQFVVDSFFLGGSPAPAPLLAAFNLSQGSTDSLVSYMFYVPNFAAPAFSLQLDPNGNVFSAFARPGAADVTSSVAESAFPFATSTFPNPVNAGEILTIDVGVSTGNIIDVVDLTGRVVVTTSVAHTNNNQVQLRLPTGIAPGLYTVTVRSADAKLLSASQVIVR